MPLNIQSAASSESLYAELRRVDISVPARTNGRTTHHTETWMMSRLLATLASADLLSYPVSVRHRDRPDFLIEIPTAKIGVEVTEAISEQYAEFCAVAEREFPDAFIDPGHFRPCSPKLSIDGMRQLLRQNRLTSDGWTGDHPEQEWALSIDRVINKKLSKLLKRDFEKFEENWLVVYDNLPLPHIYLEKAVAILLPRLERFWGRKPGFDTLLVEHGPVIARITASGADHIAINDLWE